MSACVKCCMVLHRCDGGLQFAFAPIQEALPHDGDARGRPFQPMKGDQARRIDGHRQILVRDIAQPVRQNRSRCGGHGDTPPIPPDRSAQSGRDLH